jgi:hypothetical protein
MKLLKFFLMGLLVAGITFQSCKDEESKGTCSDGIQNQDETGVDCGGVCNECREGIQGTWKSYPVAPILANFADSIVATFNTNSTYNIDQWKGGSKTVLTGTYVQTPSGVGSIYTITVNQTSPTAITAEGIFEVTDNDTKMKYEIVQTTPSIGAGAATATGGFGSSTFGGVPLGAANIQQYTRVK